MKLRLIHAMRTTFIIVWFSALGWIFGFSVGTYEANSHWNKMQEIYQHTNDILRETIEIQNRTRDIYERLIK